MRTLAIHNLKGGVGKTSSAVNLAYLAAKDGVHTLLWDLDPQGAASWYFEAEMEVSAKKMWAGQIPVGRAIHKTSFPKLDLIPSDIGARHLDAWLRKQDSSALSRLLEPLAESYSLVVLDCPPNLSHLADAIFTAADLILIPVTPTHLSLRALRAMIDYAEENGYPRKLLQPFFSMVDRRRLLHRALIEQPPKAMSDVFHSAIPYASVIERMGEHRAPVDTYAAESPAGQAYRALWSEVRARLEPF